MSDEAPQPDAPRPIGRPSGFNDDIAAEICGRLADGQSLRTICRDEHMPDASTVFRWLKSNDDFRQQYAHARELQAEAFAEDILEIADDGANDWMERTGKDGESVGWMLNGEHVQRSRLRIDARKWLASKLAPKKYGDKVEVGGPGEGGAIVHEVRRVIVDPRNT